MPELPEVEIVRQSLNKKIKGKIIKKVIVKNRNLRLKVPVNFARLLRNKKVLKVNRFSKYLILFPQNDNFCLGNLIRPLPVKFPNGVGISGYALI